jgi:hypothetical protein
MVLVKISIGYESRLKKYKVTYNRTHYYMGLIKGYSYIDKEEMFDSLEEAKYSIIQNQSGNKLFIDDDATNSLSYVDSIKLRGYVKKE